MILYTILGISIHAPARGATYSPFSSSQRLSKISIHAPARGATAIWAILHCKVKFQSTLPRGERPDASMTDVSTWQFQSTLPRGERRTLPFSSPHAHQISIHAPARGATSVKCFVIRMVKFQSTLPRGERQV